ncbi:MAG: AzlC family ABC transporter permease [Desulfobacterium sp.]|nr:AzlC family ABC transporter permease [Desulfobacterium sp.]
MFWLFTPGLALGALAQKSGMTPLGTGFMSLFVFAGSGQFIAVSMLVQGAWATAIVLTTFVVNLRHFPMGFSLSVYLGGSTRSRLTLKSAVAIPTLAFALKARSLGGNHYSGHGALLGCRHFFMLDLFAYE